MAQKAATVVPEAPHTNGAVYQPKPSPVRLLRFDPSDKSNEEYRGLTIYARMKIPMGVYFRAAGPILIGDTDYWGKAAQRQRDFAERTLVSWNAVYPEGHERAGEPIPLTPDGFMDIDIDMANAIRNAWFYTLNNALEEVAESTDPLERESPSSAGEP